MRTILPIVIGVWLALAGGGAAARAEDAAQKKVKLAIQSQTLADALAEWAEQTDYQVISAVDETTVLSAPRVTGKFTPQAALDRLLANTPLTYSWLNDRTVAIRERVLTTEVPGVRQSGQSGAPASVEQSTRERTFASGSDNRDSSPQRASSGGLGGGGDKPEIDELEEVVVTGTHIRGVSDVGAQTLSVTRSDLEASGLLTTEAVFESLPQNFSAFNFDGNVAPNSSALQGGNLEGATAIDLRGLGPQSTLVLVNGQRRAGAVQGRVVDVSAIPLSMIDRIDVVTGGHSAIYGSDAVAGVVNIVLRRKFDGGETQVVFGDSEHSGGENLQLSQMLGHAFDRGGFVAAYEYSQENSLDLLDTGLVVSPSIFGIVPQRIDLLSDRDRHSLFASGNYDLNDDVALFADGQYSTEDNTAVRNFSFAGLFDIETLNRNSRDQLSGSLGARVRLTNAWDLEVTGNHSDADTERRLLDVFAGFGQLLQFQDKASLNSASVIVNGVAPSIANIRPRIAVGIEAREEDLRVLRDGAPQTDGDRTIRSAFIELLLPLVEEGGSPGLRKLQLSLAGRYDDYSDVGSTTNPQLGVLWGLGGGVSVRGGYSTAFRAPSLLNLSPLTFVGLKNVLSPAAGGSDIPALFVGGNNPSVSPEEATTWNVGLEYAPIAAPWLHLSASYFNIEYEDRLDVPAFSIADEGLILQRAGRYGALLDQTPSQVELETLVASDDDGLIDNETGTPFDPSTQSLSDVFPGIIVFDNRLNNIAVESVDGIDFQLDTTFESGIGEWVFGFNGTYTLGHNRAVTSTSPSFGLINDVGLTPDFRARANVGFSRNALSAFVFVNYTDNYNNSLASPPTKMGSWTTVDLTLRYRSSREQGVFGGLNVAVGITNLLDESPPEFLNSSLGLRYDAANANPLGRYASVQLRKVW